MVVKLNPFFIAALFLFVIIACEKVFEADKSLVIETDRMLYALGDTVTIRIYNPTEEAVYVRRCGPRSFRFALVQLDETTNSEAMLVPDICRSFNQLRVGIMPRTETELRIPLIFDLSRYSLTDGLYQIALYMMGTIPVEPDSLIPNRTNTFVLTDGVVQ
jgi:hypothetical protein